MEMFSEREQQVIKIVGTRKLTLHDISLELFKGSRDKPFDTEISVANTVRRIIKKCSHYKLKWILVKNRDDKKLFISKGAR